MHREFNMEAAMRHGRTLRAEAMRQVARRGFAVFTAWMSGIGARTAHRFQALGPSARRC